MLYKRKSIRLKDFDYTQAFWYYVTICTQTRGDILGIIKNSKMVLNKFGVLVEKEWLNTKSIRSNVDLDSFVIMPDHLHGIIIINKQRRGTAHRAPTDTTENFGKPVPGSLPTIIRSFKATVTKQINELRQTPGIKFWQRNYYERVIRNEKELYNIRRYIKLNPLKWNIQRGYPENPEF